VLGSLAFLLVPAVYFSVELFRTLHQGMTITPQGTSMSGEMVLAFLVNLLAFTILYLAFLISRTRLGMAEEARAPEAERLTAAVVEAPDLGAIRG
jgi:ABC-type transport system involved in cytochrome c biogenesis permease subunit